MKYLVLFAFILLVGMASDDVKVFVSDHDITVFTFHKRKDCKKLSTCKRIAEITRDSAVKSLGYLPCPFCCDSTDIPN